MAERAISNIGEGLLNTLDRARELAEYKGISLVQLSKKSGINHSTLSSAKRRNTQLSIDTIQRLCDSLEISLKDFFDSEFPLQ